MLTFINCYLDQQLSHWRAHHIFLYLLFGHLNKQTLLGCENEIIDFDKYLVNMETKIYEAHIQLSKPAVLSDLIITYYDFHINPETMPFAQPIQPT